MKRIFIEKGAIQENLIILNSEQIHHLKNVLKLKPYEKLELVIPKERLLKVEFSKFVLQGIKVNILIDKFLEKQNFEKRMVIIAQGVSKKDKMAEIFDMCTQAGVDGFIPIHMQRSVAKIDAKSWEKKLLRWQRIVKQASELAKRWDIPWILKPKTMKDLGLYFKTLTDFMGIILWEDEKKINLKQILKVNKDKSILLVIGPEGGMTAREVIDLKAKGFICASLGNNIFRTEFAGLVASSMILYENF